MVNQLDESTSKQINKTVLSRMGIFGTGAGIKASANDDPQAARQQLVKAEKESAGIASLLGSMVRILSSIDGQLKSQLQMSAYIYNQQQRSSREAYIESSAAPLEQQQAVPIADNDNRAEEVSKTATMVKAIAIAGVATMVASYTGILGNIKNAFGLLAGAANETKGVNQEKDIVPPPAKPDKKATTPPPSRQPQQARTKPAAEQDLTIKYDRMGRPVTPSSPSGTPPASPDSSTPTAPYERYIPPRSFNQMPSRAVLPTATPQTPQGTTPQAAPSAANPPAQPKPKEEVTDYLPFGLFRVRKTVTPPPPKNKDEIIKTLPFGLGTIRRGKTPSFFDKLDDFVNWWKSDEPWFGRIRRDDPNKPAARPQAPAQINPRDVLNFTANTGSEAHFNRLQPETKKAILAAAQEYMQVHGEKLTINSARRSYEEQKHLYENPQGHIVAKPGTSPHEFGWAVDIAQRGKAQAIMEKYGMMWYGPGDEVHYTLKGHGGRGEVGGYEAGTTLETKVQLATEDLKAIFKEIKPTRIYKERQKFVPYQSITHEQINQEALLRERDIIEKNRPPGAAQRTPDLTKVIQSAAPQDKSVVLAGENAINQYVFMMLGIRIDGSASKVLATASA